MDYNMRLRCSDPQTLWLLKNLFSSWRLSFLKSSLDQALDTSLAPLLAVSIDKSIKVTISAESLMTARLLLCCWQNSALSFHRRFSCSPTEKK